MVRMVSHGTKTSSRIFCKSTKLDIYSARAWQNSSWPHFEKGPIHYDWGVLGKDKSFCLDASYL